MEPVSGSFMTGMPVAFSSHLPLISLLFVRPSTARRFFVYFQVNNGVSYTCWIISKMSTMMVVLSTPVSILNPNLMYSHYHWVSHTLTKMYHSSSVIIS